MRLLCLLVALSVGCKAAMPPSPPPPNPSERPRAYARFDQPVYRPGDCAGLTLRFLSLSGNLPAPTAPTVELAAGPPGKAATSRVTLPLRADGPGRYALPACVPLNGGGPTTLAVSPGAQLGALVHGGGGEPIALAFAAVAGGGQGKVRFVAGKPARPGTGALTGPKGKTLTFTADRVVVLERESGELARFLARRHGRILSSQHDHHLVAVDPTTADPNNLAPLAERLGVAPGTYSFDSERTQRLAALIVEELAGGLSLSLNVTTTLAVQPQSFEEGSKDQFTMTWFDPRKMPTGNVRFAEGMAMADIFLLPSSPPIDVAFIDRGFAGPDNFVPPKPSVVQDYGWDPGSTFASIPQCQVSETSTTCSMSTLKAEATGRANPDDPVGWHGSYVASLALGSWNDSLGVAGIGFPVARPYLIKSVGSGSFGITQSLWQAISLVAGPTTKIVNLSMYAQCVRDLGPFQFDACEGLEDAVIAGGACALGLPVFPPLSLLGCAAIAALVDLGISLESMKRPVAQADKQNVLIVASAPDDDVDANEVDARPCTLKNVICVGGLNPDFTRYGARGAAISIYAPAEGTVAMVTPDDESGAPIEFHGTSAATPLVSGALAIALSIKPALTGDDARKLLADSACKSSHPVRSDGTACTPSPDPDVDRVGYLDLLELVRQARRSAGLNPLRSCTGGWNAEELKDDDTFATALPLPVLRPELRAFVEYTPLREDDLSIHKIRKGGPSSDEDWYKVTFSLPPMPRIRGLVAKFSFKVGDPTLASLFLEVWELAACSPGGKPRPLPKSEILSELTSDGMISVTARVRTDVTYFIRVNGSIEKTGGIRVYGGNCYSHVRVDVMDYGAIPALPCQ